MKAKQIKKIRKYFNALNSYQIRTTDRLFGNFYWNKGSYTIIHACSPIRAIEIYMKRYRNLYKERNEQEANEYYETSESWGKIEVVDKKGFHHYFK